MLQTMLYEWTRVTVGGLMAATFSVPLVTVARNRPLWDEPMAVLAACLALVGLLLGLDVSAAGLYDLGRLEWPDLCLAIHSTGFGLGVSLKIAYLSMAVDQFVAVTRPLRYYQLMERALRWLLLATGLGGALVFAVGMVTGLLGLETTADRQRAAADNSSAATYTGCRWESTCTHVMSVLAELTVLVLSLVSTTLFVYTGVVEWRTKARLLRQQRSQPEVSHMHRRFFVNYRAFKRICLVLSLTLLLDVVGSLVRMVDRLYPMPLLGGLLNQGRALGFVFEGWTYGLLNEKMRNAYRAALCPCFVRGSANRPSIALLGGAAPHDNGEEENPSVLRPSNLCHGNIVRVESTQIIQNRQEGAIRSGEPCQELSSMSNEKETAQDKLPPSNLKMFLHRKGKISTSARTERHQGFCQFHQNASLRRHSCPTVRVAKGRPGVLSVTDGLLESSDTAGARLEAFDESKNSQRVFFMTVKSLKVSEMENEHSQAVVTPDECLKVSDLEG